MTIEEQRRLLGLFVRAHRERTPHDDPGSRRRTPGLRREELAARAGISATWCAWIEQGRDVNASAPALSRLAKALALTDAERAYLFELAGRRDPESGLDDPPAHAPLSVRRFVEAVAHPAYGLDRAWNACCWNAAAEHLFRGWLGEGHERNLLRYMFAAPSARALVPDWEDRAARLVAEFRADYGRRLDDPQTGAIVDRLRAESPAFAAAWEAQAVVHRAGGVRRFRHAQDGELAFLQFTYNPADRPDYTLVMLRPTDVR